MSFKPDLRLRHQPRLISRKLQARPSAIHGKGLFARRPIRAGEHLGSYRGLRTRSDGKYVLWVEGSRGRRHGRRGTTLLRYLNHADTPNAEFDGFDLFALEDIEPGEEITIHYGD